MRKILKQMILFALVAMMAFVSAGCGEKKANVEEAEEEARAYLVALGGFNLQAMESSLAEGTNEDFGVDVEAVIGEKERTDTYKLAIESMFRALSETLETKVVSAELIDDNTAVVKVQARYVDVNREAVDLYMREKTDAYVEENPEVLEMSEIERDDIGIKVMAEAYRTFLHSQDKLTTEIEMKLIFADGKWKIAKSSENEQLKQLLTEVFGTF